MIMSKADLHYAIVEEQKKFKGIVDRCKDAAANGGDEEKELYKSAYRTYTRKIKLLEKLKSELNQLTLEQGECSFENIKYSA